MTKIKSIRNQQHYGGSKEILRINIAGSALNDSGHMSCFRLHYLLREAKITNLSIHLLVQKDVTAFHITVYDSRLIPVV